MADLTEQDRQIAFGRIVGRGMLEQLDTRMSTDDTVKWLKARMSCFGGTSTAPDGPYSDGKNDEYWSLSFDQEKRGFMVKIRHTVRDRGSYVIREGLMPWNNIANRATIAACEMQGKPLIPKEMVETAEEFGMTRDELESFLESAPDWLRHKVGVS